MAYNKNLREEEIKNKLRMDYFKAYDATKILGNIDFAVAIPTDNAQLFETEYLLWAESKKGAQADIYESFVQLILTIGKARTFDKHLPPAFLGAFDCEKIAFIPYNTVLDIFYQNDFNWKVTPSDHSTKEFKQILATVRETLERNLMIFNFSSDEKELRRFIRENFIIGKSRLSKIRINKNNFTAIYQKWLKEVKPTIGVDWDKAKQKGILDAYFYLADILSEHNITLKEKLFVLLRKNYYELDRKIDDMGMFDSKKAQFNDNQVAHTQFWNRYSRPPKREYWDYIVERVDLLVPQDVRERKGSYFTPQCWVELSQQYIAAELGENWQDEYYVWDCAAGTGNLLAGLINKYNIWASTLDKADVGVMHDRIQNGANLLESHVFQFDFLNDPFTKLPQPLREIIEDEERRKKLVIYINPPYAEATSATTVTGTGKNKVKVATENYTAKKYKSLIKNAANELFAQFFIRIQQEIKGCVLAEFSTLKILQAQNFADFRKIFASLLAKIFIVPAATFNNVNGQFPIGFMIWRTDKTELFESVEADVFNEKAEFIGKKHFYGNLPQSINKWIKLYDIALDEIIGYMENPTPDLQNNKYLCIINHAGTRHNNYSVFNKNSLIAGCIYFSARSCIEATWQNDRDQFLFPNDGWGNDTEFQNNCLAYTLFHGQNRITSRNGINHWIPFTEEEVEAQEKFKSHFMTDYISGKNRPTNSAANGNDLFNQSKGAIETPTTAEPLVFSAEAKDVFDAGRELWKYYHKQADANADASFYDIRLHFQGRNDKDRMNSGSTDAQYTELIGTLRKNLKVLASKIEPKVYEYGFLKQ